MNNEQYTEDQSLLEVREWKEQCRQETEHFTPEEYITWIRAITEKLMAQYHLKLHVVHR
ncbi:MAG: hypothetical protein GY797_39540 [Deltaproteobacteria bacterium]|nr:hypothetical protein [Deltaproteobacteria bacterium]